MRQLGPTPPLGLRLFNGESESDRLNGELAVRIGYLHRIQFNSVASRDEINCNSFI